MIPLLLPLLSLTTELYVVLFFVAAAVVAFAVRPAGSGPVRQHLLAGELSAEGPEEESVDIVCAPDGTVTLWRNGLSGLTTDDAVSLAVTVKGFDVEIIERINRGRVSTTASTPVDSARFDLAFLAREHYRLRYIIDSTVAAAFTLHVKEGVTRHEILSL